MLFNTAEMSCVLNEMSYDQTADTADVTTFCSSGDREYIAGIRQASGSFGGLHDGSTAETDRLFHAAAGGSSAAVITLGAGGDAVGSAAFLAAGHVTQYSVNAPTGDVVAANASVQYTSESRGGVWLKPLASIAAATTSHGTVALGGSSQSTRGGVGHLHVTAGTTGVGNDLAVKIQDSSNGTVWADLITFTAVDSTAPISGVERVLTTGVVNDNVRATSTGGSAGATFAVAFARN